MRGIARTKKLLSNKHIHQEVIVKKATLFKGESKKVEFHPCLRMHLGIADSHTFITYALVAAPFFVLQEWGETSSSTREKRNCRRPPPPSHGRTNERQLYTRGGGEDVAITPTTYKGGSAVRGSHRTRLSAQDAAATYSCGLSLLSRRR